MKKRQWAIIYRLFGRSRTRETWPTLFPALVPVKSSLNFMQIKDPRKRSYRCMWEHLTTPFHSEGQIFDGVWQDVCHAYFMPPNGATLNQFLHSCWVANLIFHIIKKIYTAPIKMLLKPNMQFDMMVNFQGIWNSGPFDSHQVWEERYVDSSGDSEIKTLCEQNSDVVSSTLLGKTLVTKRDQMSYKMIKEERLFAMVNFM